MNTNFDITVIGAGASGLMTALTASKSGRRIVIIDHRKDFGQKLLISGGGKCNFTNLNMSHKNFISQNPHFVKSAIARYTPNDFLDFLNENNIEYFEKQDGQMFLKGSANQILKLFVKKLNENKVEFIFGNINSIDKNEIFNINGTFGKIRSTKLIISTGGLSYPKLGATDFGYKIAKQFGHNVISPKPALVPFIFSEKEQQLFSKLSGISFFAKISIGNNHITDNCLFTHKGISGPAILKISAFWQNQEKIVLDFMPNINILKEIKNLRTTSGKSLFKSYLYHYLSQRISDILCNNYIESKRLADYSDKEISDIESKLHNFVFVPKSTEGFEKAEVTAGGIDTKDISSKTMESKLCEGIYFTGEVLDVTGDLGGYNLHFAWASGFVAGTYSSAI